MFDGFWRADFHAEPRSDDHLNVLLPVYFAVFGTIIVSQPERAAVSIVSEGVDVITVVVGFHTSCQCFIAKSAILYIMTNYLSNLEFYLLLPGYVKH